jgi:hypothetical protein
MRLRRAGCRIGVAADVRFRQQIADRIVGEGFCQRCRTQADRGRGQPVDPIVGEALAEIGVGVAARERVTEQIVGETQILHRIADAGRNAGQAPGFRVEAVGGDKTIARGLLCDVPSASIAPKVQ